MTLVLAVATISSLLALAATQFASSCADKVLATSSGDIKFENCDAIGDAVELFHSPLSSEGSFFLFGIRSSHRGLVAVGFPQAPGRTAPVRAIVGYPTSRGGVTASMSTIKNWSAAQVSPQESLVFDNAEFVNGYLQFTAVVDVSALLPNTKSKSDRVEIAWALGRTPASPASLSFRKGSPGTATIVLGPSSLQPSATPTPTSPTASPLPPRSTQSPPPSSSPSPPTPTATPPSSSAASPTTTPEAGQPEGNPTSSNRTVSGGSIAGAVFGGLTLVGYLAVAATACVYRRRSTQNANADAPEP